MLKLPFVGVIVVLRFSGQTFALITETIQILQSNIVALIGIV